MSEENQPTGPSPSSSKRVRMRDVAARCGVSVSTVSLVLSGDPRIPEDTTRKVLQTVKAMEYRPNIIARNLARKGSRTIGVILPEFAFTQNQPYFYEALRGIHSETQPAGYKMVVEAANKIFLERRYYHRLLKEQSTDAIVYMAAQHQDFFLSDMIKEPYPFVLLGNAVEGVALPLAVSSDQQAAKLATHHLIRLGHTNIGFLGGTAPVSILMDRQKGFQQAMEEAGLKFQPDLVTLLDKDIHHILPSVERLLAQRVTAIVAVNDYRATGVLRCLQEKNIRVPNDVAVMGLDDIELASFLTPSLSTVRTHIREIAASAARFAIRNIHNPMANKTALDPLPQPELVIRQSCGGQNAR